MMPRYFVVELLKLRRSLALLLCVAAPSCIAVLGLLMLFDRAKPLEWIRFTAGNAALWAFAMLPLAVTALSVLMAQMEHGPKSWNHMLTLPGARPRIFLAKAMVMLVLVAGMSVMLFALLYLAGIVAQTVRPGVLTGDPGVAETARILGAMFGASMLVCMLQLWVALRFASFVPPLVFGIAGTFVAIGATAARQGIYFPWLLATNVLSRPERADFAVALGAIGGVLTLVLMLVDLSRRDI